MKFGLLLLLCSYGNRLMALEHSLHAHVHGAVKLSIAVEKKSVDIDIDAPAESFLSFEYIPKTASEKKMLNDLTILWEKQLFTLLIFDKKDECRIAQSQLNQVLDQEGHSGEKQEGVHSDIEAKAKIICAKNIEGHSLQINFLKFFKNIKNLHVEVIGEEVKSYEITKINQEIKL